jgi:Subtilase family
MTLSDSVNLLYSTYPRKAPKYLGRRDNPLAGKFPNMNLATQNGAPHHLSQLSNGMGESLTSYRYNRVAGLGSFVYIVDVGLLPSNHHVQKGDLSRSGLYGGGSNDNRMPEEYSVDENNLYSDNKHGSLIAALAVNDDIGIARKAKLVSVKVTEGRDTVFTTLGLLDGIMWAINDIVQLNRQGTAVITISLGKYLCGL